MGHKVFTGNIRNVYAAGDMHGDYESYSKILHAFEKYKEDSLLIFMGDYADRGPKGVEIIMDLVRLQSAMKDIIALKGNHELYDNGSPTFYPCDLISEAKIKYGSWEKFYSNVMLGFLEKLYIAAIINNVLFVHAGISSKIKYVEDLSKRENEINLLWSDPSARHGEHRNPRGAGLLFGEDITRKVLSSLGLKMIVRGHEPGKAVNGPYTEHAGKVITVNSSFAYGRPFILRIDTVTLEYEPVYLQHF
ncbi:MAG: serine/threonine protein phosphatase [Nitrospirae bacterium]|nr:serine/threonine protein phosphatase [Nitrospirota bacterium]